MITSCKYIVISEVQIHAMETLSLWIKFNFLWNPLSFSVILKKISLKPHSPECMCTGTMCTGTMCTGTMCTGTMCTGTTRN